ncbi:MAG: membrane protein insertion efficiency factor YidD [Alphaproteobacteria bacterium]
MTHCAPISNGASRKWECNRMSLNRALQVPVRFYRFFISPLLGPSCRFHPSCSMYALEALETHGPVKGLYLAVRRLGKCHPWHKGPGVDHVPPRHVPH